MEIRVEDRSVAVTMRTPGHDHELAAGFLLTEGVIARAEDVLDVSACETPETEGARNIVNVRLRRPETVDFTRLTRHVFSTSSCGLCGKATIESVQARCPPLRPDEGLRGIGAAALEALPDRLATGQTVFQRTGGLHAAALFTAEGALAVLREDVGRHNAVDKVLGYALLTAGIDAADCGLFVSGRISFEIVQKALAARIAVVAGISAPTSLAVDFARASGQALVGFLRAGRLNIYAGAERLR